MAATRALLRQSARQVCRHPAQIVLSLMGIGLGVAVVLGIDLARASARQSFDTTVDDLAGKATHHIVGGPGGIDETVYAGLRVRHGVYPTAPVVEAHVTVTGHPQVRLKWLGVDPLAESSFRGTVPATQGRSTFDLIATLMTEPGSALLSRHTAASLALRVNDTFKVDHNGIRHALRIAGWIESAGNGNADRYRDWLITDISTAQEMLGMRGRLTRIDLMAHSETQAERIRESLPPEVELISSARRSDALEQLTRAFMTQLQALSLFALLVGMFLIYNTMTFHVLQRREMLGILRAVGVTRSEVFMLVQVESLFLAIAGTLAGIIAGIVLGKGLTHLVARTISDHYYALAVHGLALSPWLVVKSAAVGLASTLVAALPPAVAAARVTPSMAMRRVTAERDIGRGLRALAIAGVLLLIAATGVLSTPGGPTSGFLGLALFVFGCAALTPGVCAAVLRPATPLLARLLGWRAGIAAGGLASSLSRTAPAVTALMLAIATTIGISLMLKSFRGAVDEWLSQLLRADLYISATREGQESQPLPADLAARLRALPDVEAISTARRLALESPEARHQLVIYQLAPESYAGFHFLSGGGEDAWAAFDQGDAVIVTEPYAIRHDLAVGDSVQLRTEHGLHRFAVAGVYRDYSSDQGLIAMSRRTYSRHFDDPVVTGIGVYGGKGVTSSALTRSVQSIVGSFPQLSIATREELRRSSLQIFDRTFTVTEVLRLIAGVIAFIGVAGSLIALQLERRYEHGVLRATGVTPAELATVIIGQSALMGVLAGLLALVVGIGMAAALVHVINVRAFAWSMNLHVDPALLIHGLLLATLAALMAGLFAAFAAARSSPIEALRRE